MVIATLAYKYNSILGSLDTTGLFSRTGSIVVLLAAINEYRLRNFRDKQLDYLEPKVIQKQHQEIRKLAKPKVLLGQKIITISSHILLIVGTAIWGFGDLIV